MDVSFDNLVQVFGVGVAAIIGVVAVVLKLRSNGRDDPTTRYIKESIQPQLRRLENGHIELLKAVSSLPTRQEYTEAIKDTHVRISKLESEVNNLKDRR